MLWLVVLMVAVIIIGFTFLVYDAPPYTLVSKTPCSETDCARRGVQVLTYQCLNPVGCKFDGKFSTEDIVKVVECQSHCIQSDWVSTDSPCVPVNKETPCANGGVGVVTTKNVCTYTGRPGVNMCNFPGTKNYSPGDVVNTTSSCTLPCSGTT
jgi:hypothetical protein